VGFVRADAAALLTAEGRSPGELDLIDRMMVDLSGSASQVAGAFNVPWASTRAGVVYALRAMTDPGMTTNDGIMRPLDIVCPTGNIFNPRPPAAVSVRHNTCQRLADVLVRAFSELWPDRAVASSTVTFVGMNLSSSSLAPAIAPCSPM